MILRKTARLMAAGALSTAVLVGALTFTSSAPSAGPIKPLCGPTFQWSCTAIGGPSFLFIGTICEKRRYERATGRKCVKI